MMSGESSKKKGKNCEICSDKVSKYCCPRCEIFYCSLDCYKAEIHSECSEGFYRDWVTSELAQQTDDNSKETMYDILKSIHYRDLDHGSIEDIFNDFDANKLDSDDELGLDLEDRLKDLNLDDADAIWNVLTGDEKNEFEALVCAGDIGSIVPQWKPWWTYSKERKLVEEDNNKAEKEENEALKKCPTIIEVPKFNTLTTVEPSPAVRYNMLNVLGAYVFVMRYFNGEIEPIESATYILNICANLDINANFESPSTALHSVAQRCQQSQLIETDEASLEVMRHDAFLVLQGPSVQRKRHYCKSGLSHVHKIFTDSLSAKKSPLEEKNVTEKKEFSKKFPQRNKKRLLDLDVNKVKICIKKVEYYLSFINSYEDVSSGREEKEN